MPKSRPNIPDTAAEFMQLSLFSEVPDAPPVDTLKEESTNARNGRPDTARTSDSGTLEQVPAEMVATLTAQNQLPQAIFAAQELTGNLLYELAVVRKMDYQMAWELATREWAFLPDEEDQPQLSFDPATLDPNQPLPAITV